MHGRCPTDGTELPTDAGLPGTGRGPVRCAQPPPGGTGPPAAAEGSARPSAAVQWHWTRRPARRSVCCSAGGAAEGRCAEGNGVRGAVGNEGVKEGVVCEGLRGCGRQRVLGEGASLRPAPSDRGL